MRVALVAESFLPHTNGVTHSLLRVIEHLERRGDEALVIAPEGKGSSGPVRYGIAPVVRVPSVGWPGYPDVRVTMARQARLERLLADYQPDVVHLASPFMLGWAAVRAANALALPTVAVYQTDIPSYASRYHAAWGESMLWNRVRMIHEAADVTLAPSTVVMDRLHELGVPRLRWWPRGVDTERFHPSRRSDALRREWASEGETVVGYVGRLAPEKQVEDLVALADLPGVKLVIIGDGPQRQRLENLLPGAHFTGHLGGSALAEAMASLDVFVHCGEMETFCQTIQEAHASGVPVVATRAGGPIDLVDHATTGYLYSPGNLRQLAHFVGALAHHADSREAMGQTARATVEHRTWPAVCDILRVHYREAIGGNVTAPRKDLAGPLGGAA